MTRRAVILGTGSALPARRVSNEELSKTVETSDDWIVERTGIRFRYIAGDGETTATLGAEAARKALDAAATAAPFTLVLLGRRRLCCRLLRRALKLGRRLAREAAVPLAHVGDLEQHAARPILERLVRARRAPALLALGLFLLFLLFLA